VTQNPLVYPYIPNSVPEIKARMLEAVGAQSAAEFYASHPRRAASEAPPEPARAIPIRVRLAAACGGAAE
jgi:glycine dehydrogenase subunit 1